MKQIILFIIVCIVFSCGNEKVIQLPEITHSDITEIQDVSAAYLFYDETQKDNVFLNRKNLISTTNWLVNVDKRLSLKQVIPHITFLQEKKEKAGHKNINAKNYFTCNDLSRNNLGFLEFKNLVYHEESAGEYFSKISTIPEITRLSVICHSMENIEIMGFIDSLITKKANYHNVTNQIKSLMMKTKSFEIILNFNEKITFQEYISIKSAISKIDLENVLLSNHEFIYN
ncbi:hypothetical protein [Litoribaculum gwangyangense]|uniref:Lipoprotein n=1 Tax=Litoribaculum gwangyangense TaxID=1130722 RepID=A0ABP9CT60_9FLAO